MFGEYKTIALSIENSINFIGTGLQPPPAFRPKLVYSYVIEVADSESDGGLFSTALV